MSRLIASWLLALSAGAFSAAATGAELHVGPGKPFATPSAACAAARDGDTVLIAPGRYAGDVCTWTARDLTLRADGGPVELAAEGKAAAGKAIWVLAGAHATVAGITFSGCAVPDRNGAGIRVEGADPVIRGCVFRDNQDGILTGADAASDVLIEQCEFAGNGAGDGQSHNLYIGRVRSLTFRGNYSHGAKVGHLLKSRARINRISANRLEDGADGTSSYAIDLPEGGDAQVVGNLIVQAPSGSNRTLVAFALEKATPNSRLLLIGNTLVNDGRAGDLVRVAAGGERVDALLAGNLVLGAGTVLAGPGTELHDVVLTDRRTLTDDWRPRRGSPAVDALPPVLVDGIDLRPAEEYVHPCAWRARPRGDVGCFAAVAP